MGRSIYLVAYIHHVTFIRKHRRGNCVVYAEVENRWVDGKVKQFHLRYLGTRPNAPRQTYDLDPVHAGALAIGLMERTLTPDDVFQILDAQGIPYTRMSLEKVGLFFHFPTKNLSICLSPAPPRRSRPGARPAGSRSRPGRPGAGGTSPSTARAGSASRAGSAPVTPSPSSSRRRTSRPSSRRARATRRT